MGANVPSAAPTAGIAPVAANPANPTTVSTPASDAPAPQQTTAPVEPPPIKSTAASLDEVLAARKDARLGTGQPTPQDTPPEPLTPQPENPQPEPTQKPDESGQPTVDPVSKAKDQLFELSQTDPAKLIAMLQVAQGQQGQNQPIDPNTPATPEAQRPMTVDEFRASQEAEAQQFIAERQPITLKSVFGDDVFEELGIPDRDLTTGFENFIQRSVAPMIASVMTQMFAMNSHYQGQFAQVQPLVQTHESTALQQQMGQELTQVFPALAADQQAVAFADKRFNELAPILMPPDLMKNPHANPKEYARITVAIARIAAGEYSTQTPANTPAAPVAMPAPASVPPEPQPVQSQYRNHIGQFQTNAAPTTLDAFNQKRLEVLFPA